MKFIKRNVATLVALVTLSLVLASYTGLINPDWVTAPTQNGCYRTITAFCDTNGNTFMETGECVYDVADPVASAEIACTRGNFICCYQLNSFPCATCGFSGYQFSFIRFKQFPD